MAWAALARSHGIITATVLLEFLSLFVGILAFWTLQTFRIRPRAPRLAQLFYGTERRAVITLLLAGFCAAALSSSVRPPEPVFHDEFSYLLGADTFAAGRLTNPPHPHWRHFETFHVLQQPTYQSKYLPAQALVISMGQIVTGSPIVGVWLSVALACAALYWCLRPWMPRRWAFYGGLFPGVVFGMGPFVAHLYFAYWSTTFWGGSVPMLAACLVLGSVVRFLKSQSAKPALLGLGLAVLIASRPYEGLLLAGPALLAMFYPLQRRRFSLADSVRALAPAAAVLVAGLCWLGYYNWRGVGSPTSLPYEVYLAQYDTVPLFKFAELTEEPAYRHDILRRFQQEYRQSAVEWSEEPPLETLSRAARTSMFFLGIPLSFVAAFAFLVWRGAWSLFARGLLLIGLFSHTITWAPTLFPHYFSTFVPLAILMALRGLRTIGASGRRREFPGRIFARGMVSATAAVFVLSLAMQERSQNPPSEFAAARMYLQAELEAMQGKQLVIVRYSPTHMVHQEWVYNRADIDGARVVWAREMSPSENAELLAYFSDRQAWLFEPDAPSPGLRPYSQ